MSEVKKKKKGKGLRIFLIILLLILVVIIGLGIWQRQNISAALHGLQSSTEDIQQEMEQNEQEMDDAVSDYNIPDTEVTDEVAEGIVDGTMDVNKVVDDLLKNQSSASSGSSSASSASSDPEIQRLITKLYVLRGSYTSRLNGLIGAAKSEYNALPESQRTDTARRRIVSSKISQGSAMEGACDAQVSAIVSQIRSRLKETGQSTALADQIMSTYQSEKQLRKSYYMSLV